MVTTCSEAAECAQCSHFCFVGPHAEAETGLDILECWHLTSQELESLTRDCLLPLAPAHASIELAQNLQAASESTSKTVNQQPVQATGMFTALDQSCSPALHAAPA